WQCAVTLCPSLRRRFPMSDEISPILPVKAYSQSMFTCYYKVHAFVYLQTDFDTLVTGTTHRDASQRVRDVRPRTGRDPAGSPSPAGMNFHKIGVSSEQRDALTRSGSFRKGPSNQPLF